MVASSDVVQWGEAKAVQVLWDLTMRARSLTKAVTTQMTMPNYSPPFLVCILWGQGAEALLGVQHKARGLQDMKLWLGVTLGEHHVLVGNMVQ
jgi:hypothetical protein